MSHRFNWMSKKAGVLKMRKGVRARTNISGYVLASDVDCC